MPKSQTETLDEGVKEWHGLVNNRVAVTKEHVIRLEVVQLFDGAFVFLGING